MQSDRQEIPQHMKALEKANRVRFARAETKRAIKRREMSVADLIRGRVPWEVRAMPIAELLGAQNRWGTTRVRNLLAPLAINESRTVASLTPRQRRDIADALAGVKVPDRRLLAA